MRARPKRAKGKNKPSSSTYPCLSQTGARPPLTFAFAVAKTTAICQQAAEPPRASRARLWRPHISNLHGRSPFIKQRPPVIGLHGETSARRSTLRFSPPRRMYTHRDGGHHDAVDPGTGVVENNDHAHDGSGDHDHDFEHHHRHHGAHQRHHYHHYCRHDHHHSGDAHASCSPPAPPLECKAESRPLVAARHGQLCFLGVVGGRALRGIRSWGGLPSRTAAGHSGNQVFDVRGRRGELCRWSLLRTTPE